MKSVPKLIKRFVGILLLSSFLILVFNILLMIVISSDSTAGGSPWSAANDVAASLTQTEDGYALSDSMAQQLMEQDVWAILIDNSTGKVIWHTESLPGEIPMQYSLAAVAVLSRSYVKDYPTFTSAYNDDLVVLGFPKTRYWRAIYNNWDYDFIANLPKTVLLVVLGNVVLIFLIYMIANTRLLKSVGPILKGIEALPTENDVHVKEKGTLSEIAKYINRTSEILQTKNYELKQKEMARANWIAGVSHDIRTPLSMVMGYAGQLENDPVLPKESRKKAAVICSQSVRIKNLINDLNLASKLEYNMQPFHLDRVNVVALVRQVITDFINSGFEDKYPIQWDTDEQMTTCFITADIDLLKRAIVNLILNSQNHNPGGCTISLNIKKASDRCHIIVSDNGIGSTPEKLKEIQNTPHYLVCDSSTTDQRHGLGLLIVQQIVKVHGGFFEVFSERGNGFITVLSFPVVPEQKSQ